MVFGMKAGGSRERGRERGRAMIKWLFDVDAFGGPIGGYLPQHLV